MTMIERLLWLADDLATRSNELRSSMVERRAVSTAYYAVFHALAHLCATELLRVDAGIKDNYERVYRALDHGSLKTAFKSEPLKSIQQLKLIGERVVELQSERIRSDYLPSRRLYKKEECARLVQSAKSTIALLEQLSAQDRQTLAVFLVFKNRTS